MFFHRKTQSQIAVSIVTIHPRDNRVQITIIHTKYCHNKRQAFQKQASSQYHKIPLTLSKTEVLSSSKFVWLLCRLGAMPFLTLPDPLVTDPFFSLCVLLEETDGTNRIWLMVSTLVCHCVSVSGAHTGTEGVDTFPNLLII